jgi:spermidine synthase
MSELLISEQNGLRTLHFGSEWVQGRMRISRPAELMLGYAQDMCAALLFVPPPKQIYVAGLGVGSLPRWALANWDDAIKRMEIVELRADVLALARTSFPLPTDDSRVVLTQGDAAKVIGERPAASVDWMWVAVGWVRWNQTTSTWPRTRHSKRAACLLPTCGAVSPVIVAVCAVYARYSVTIILFYCQPLPPKT